MYPLAKTEVALNRVSAAQKQVRLCSTGIWGDTCLDDIIFNLHLRDVQSVLYEKRPEMCFILSTTSPNEGVPGKKVSFSFRLFALYSLVKQKKNLTLHQKSLRALLHVPLQIMLRP